MGKFYKLTCFEMDPIKKESPEGQWATRETYEKVERERDLCKFEAERQAKLVSALIKDYEWRQDAIAMARMVQVRVRNALMVHYGVRRDSKELEEYCQNDLNYQEAQAIIDRAKADQVRRDGSRVGRFAINRPSEYEAGILGYSDVCTVSLESGDPGGDPGQFEGELKGFLEEWFDGARVSLEQD